MAMYAKPTTAADVYKRQHWERTRCGGTAQRVDRIREFQPDSGLSQSQRVPGLIICSC